MSQVLKSPANKVEAAPSPLVFSGKNATRRRVHELCKLFNKAECPLAACARAAAGRSGFEIATLARKTLRLFPAKQQIEMAARRFNLRDWVLRHDAAVVLDLDLQTIMRQDTLPQLQNFGETSVCQVVIDVFAYPCLQKTGLGFGGQSTAVDRLFCDMADFRYVKVRRDLAAIG